MPRLLFVVNDAAFFMSHRLPLAVGARASGYDVVIATAPSKDAEAIRAAGFPWESVPLSRSGLNPAGELTTIAGLARLYRRVRPDVVHHVTAKPILYGGIAARAVGVPAVVHAITGLGYAFISSSQKARAIRLAIRNGYRVATSHPNCAVIFQNPDDRAAFGSAIRTSNIVMIPGSGVDRERFRPTPLPSGRPIVLLPARMLWDKGVAEFVEAARTVNLEGARARFVLAGGVDDGNPAAVPRALLEKLASEGVVEWWGHQTKMHEVLEQATIVCLPSYREGFPKSLLEACAAGRPIVTTDAPGCREVLRGGAHGVLVAPRDGAALARAVSTLLDDPSRLRTMGDEAAEFAERFDVKHVVARTLAVYSDLLLRRAA